MYKNGKDVNFFKKNSLDTELPQAGLYSDYEKLITYCEK